VIRDIKDCIVISVAHRIASIVDYDRVIVLDQGLIVEEGSPKLLLAEEDSKFRQLCLASGDIEGLVKKANREAPYSRID